MYSETSSPRYIRSVNDLVYQSELFRNTEFSSIESDPETDSSVRSQGSAASKKRKIRSSTLKQASGSLKPFLRKTLPTDK